MPDLTCDDLDEAPSGYVAGGDTDTNIVEEMDVHLEGHGWSVGKLSSEEHKQQIEPWNKYITVR